MLLKELAQFDGMYCSLNESTLAKACKNVSPKLEVLVAHKSDLRSKIIGCGLFYAGFDVISASYGVHLSDIIVAKNQRKSGIGTKLIQAICEATFKQGGEWISWTVDKKNLGAKQFYAKLDATQVDCDFMAIGSSAMQILCKNHKSNN